MMCRRAAYKYLEKYFFFVMTSLLLLLVIDLWGCPRGRSFDQNREILLNIKIPFLVDYGYFLLLEFNYLCRYLVPI